MLYVLICAMLVIFDFASKRIALGWLKDIKTFPVLEGVFHLTYVENTGAAFGMLQNRQALFVGIGIACLFAVLLYFKLYKNRSRQMDVGMLLLVSGAVGNLIDRIAYGYVVDFFDFRLINFPVFNVADIFICTGAGLIALYVLFFEKGEKNKENGDRAGIQD